MEDDMIYFSNFLDFVQTLRNVSNSCWLDSFFVNLFCNGKSPIIKQIRNFDIDDLNDYVGKIKKSKKKLILNKIRMDFFMKKILDKIEKRDSNIKISFNTEVRSFLNKLKKSLELESFEKITGNGFGNHEDILNIVNKHFGIEYLLKKKNYDGGDLICYSIKFEIGPIYGINGYTKDKNYNFKKFLKIAEEEVDDFCKKEIIVINYEPLSMYDHESIKSENFNIPLIIEICGSVYTLRSTVNLKKRVSHYTSIVSDSDFNFYYINVMNGNNVIEYKKKVSHFDDLGSYTDYINNHIIEGTTMKESSLILFYYKI